MKQLSVILPVKNEEKRLSITLSDIHTFLTHRNIKHEIIAVISPSEDNSLEIAQRLEHSIKELVVIELKADNGKGFALKKGAKKAKNDWLLFMDSDNAVSIEELEKMIPYTDQFQLIIGQRKNHKATSEGRPNFKEKCGKVCRSIVSAWSVHDSQCGFKLISKKLVNKIIKKSRVNSHSFETEIIAIAEGQCISLKQIPVSWQDTRREEQSFKDYGDGLKNFIDIKEGLKKGSYKGF
jgi:dolichyl-phosphate beta-glucosyltransferase